MFVPTLWLISTRDLFFYALLTCIPEKDTELQQYKSEQKNVPLN